MSVRDWSKLRHSLPHLLFVAIAVLLLVVSLRTALESPLKEGAELDIVAHLDLTDDDNWNLTGRVLHDGEPVANGAVWVILKDARGNRDAPPVLKTDSQGGFIIEPIPRAIGREAVEEATIFARAEETTPQDGVKILWGEEILRIAGPGSLRNVKLSVRTLLPLPVIFLLSAVLPFIGTANPLRHGCSIFLAFLFTATMIAFLSLGLSYVKITAKKGEVLSLGFASLYHGTYVEEAEPEWLFSFTEPPPLEQPPQKQPNVVQGFGAPLWVLLLSVVGSALLTVTLIVNEISSRPDFNNLDEARKRDELIVRHQFFILFAPLGAIFVYQLLVVAEAAEQPVTVALAAIGAGASLNNLLTRAVRKSKDLLKP